MLIEPPEANLGRIMRHINGVYTQRHNRMKKTDGSLFRGRYKAILVDADNYLLQLSRYIHRNPIEGKSPIVEDLVHWAWSSYPAYVCDTPAPFWLQREKVYGMLNKKNKGPGYREFVSGENNLDLKQFYNKGNVPAILGTSDFKEKIIKQEKLSEKETLKRVITRPSAEEITHVVANIFGISPQDIRKRCTSRRHENLARQLALYSCQQLGGMSLNEIAHYFNFSSDGSVAGRLGIVKKKLLDDELAMMYKQIKEHILSIKYT